MTTNIGTLIVQPIKTYSSDDTFPTHIDEYGKGGYRSVDTIAERDSIPFDRQKEGMAVYVVETGLAYILLNCSSDLVEEDWTQFKLGSGTVGFHENEYDHTLIGSALQPNDIGVTVQAYDSTILTDSDIGVTVQAYDSTILTDSDIGVTIAPALGGDDNYVTNDEKIVLGNTSGVNTGDNPGVTSVSGTSPVVSSGGDTPIISMQAATNTVDGYATSVHITAIEANTNKVSNIPTELSIGTVTGTTLAITSDGSPDDVILPEATTTESGLLSASKFNDIVANTSKISYTDADKVADYPYMPEIPDNRYLADDGTFKPVAVGSGSYAANLYLSNVDSADSGYKKLSYTPDVGEVTKIITANNNTVQGEKYLFDAQIGITVINPGNWIRSFTRKVDSTLGDSTFHIRAFMYTIGGVENDLFTLTSSSIDDVDFVTNKVESTQTEFTCNTTDRFGIQISFTTTNVGNIILSYLIGDGNAAHILTPLAIRHTSLRSVNEDPEVQHMTSAEKTILDNTSGTNTGDQDLSGYALTSSLGTAAAEDVGFFATAAQGSLADTALQSETSHADVLVDSDIGVTVQSYKLNNYSAITAPTIDDDVDLGYSIGSIWIDVIEDKVYTCVDITADNAVWTEGGGGGSDVLNKYDATTAPTINDDVDLGYSVGSTWVDVTGNKVYICVDNVGGAAIWLDLMSETSHADVLVDSDIGVTVQAYDSTILTDSDIGVNVQAYDSTILTDSDVGVTVQAYDSNLTSFVTTFTLPEVDSTAGYVLRTNGAGVLSFIEEGSDVINKYDAITAPTVNDDVDLGYSIGSSWVDVITDKAYTCVDNVGGAAIWLEDIDTGHSIKKDGSLYNQRSNLNFVGSNLIVTDDDVNDATIISISPTYTANNTIQQAFVNVNQNDVKNISHSPDPLGRRIVQVSEFVAGSTGVSNTSLDFDTIDENDFIQEDSINGTDFLNGVVRLHAVSLGGGSFESTPTNLVNEGSYNLISASGYNGAQDGTGLFDGIRNITATTSNSNFYLYGTSDYVEIELFETCRVWRSGLAAYPTINGPYDIYEWNGVDYVFRETSLEISVTNTQWGLFTSELPPNKYKFKYNARSVDSEWFVEGKGSIYTTTQPYYVTTSDTNQIPLGNVSVINSCIISNNQPVNTLIKGLVSFDDRTTWKKWSGSAWVDASVTTLDVFDFNVNGNTITEIQTGLVGYTTVLDVDTRLDFVFDLSTTDNTVTPSIDLISLNYDEIGAYEVKGPSDYTVSFDGPDLTSVTKVLAGTQNIKVDILLGENLPKSTYDATTAPTVDDDVDLGYSIGSIWIDITGDKVYTCVDNTDGAAVWVSGLVGADIGVSVQPYDSTLIGGVLTDYTETTNYQTTIGNITLDLSTGNVQRIILDGNREITLPADPGAVTQSFVLILECATFTPTWAVAPAVEWLTSDGSPPTLVTTINLVNVLTFIWDDVDSRWLGFLAGKETL